MPREVQEIDTGKDLKEAAQQRDGVDRIRSVEALEQNKRGTKCGGCEGDVVERVYAVTKLILARRLPFWGSFTYIEVENEFNALLK